MESKYFKTTDAVVDAEDAAEWTAELVKVKPDELITRLLRLEPFVLGVAIHTSSHLAAKLRKARVPEFIVNDIEDKIIITTAFAIELMHRGQRKLWAEIIDPLIEEPETGKQNGQ